jgi:hypothetical protein
MLIKKITHGYVSQTYDTETGRCVSQDFIPVFGEGFEYQTMHGENFDVDNSETELEYQPYNMEQPI